MEITINASLSQSVEPNPQDPEESQVPQDPEESQDPEDPKVSQHPEESQESRIPKRDKRASHGDRCALGRQHV